MNRSKDKNSETLYQTVWFKRRLSLVNLLAGILSCRIAFAYSFRWLLMRLLKLPPKDLERIKTIVLWNSNITIQACSIGGNQILISKIPSLLNCIKDFASKCHFSKKFLLDASGNILKRVYLLRQKNPRQTKTVFKRFKKFWNFSKCFWPIFQLNFSI